MKIQEWEEYDDNPIGLFYQDTNFEFLDSNRRPANPIAPNISAPNIASDFILIDLDYVTQFRPYFPSHCVFGHILEDTNPLDEVDSWKEVLPSRKPRSVDPRKLSATK